MLGNNRLTIGSWNAWSGCVAGTDGYHSDNAVVDFIAEEAGEFDIFGLYEVHCKRSTHPERFAMPRNPKGRPGPLDLELGDRLIARLKRTHRHLYVGNFTTSALHDCEASLIPVDYGNLVFIRREVQIQGTVRSYIYGMGELNTEDRETRRGRIASRRAIGLTVALGNHNLTMLFVHGVWSKHGKIDMPARLVQSSNMAKAIIAQRRRLKLDVVNPATLIMGDLNYTSDLKAMEFLLDHKDAFGNQRGINLNSEFGILNTRTRHYPWDKPTREANFALVSQLTNQFVENYDSNDQVPSDHALLRLTLNTSPGTR